MNLVAGTGRFLSFSYHAATKEGKEGLVIRAEEKQYAPPFVNLGTIIDGSGHDNVRFTANARITALDLGGFRSEWRTDISVDSTWALSSEYYRPFNAAARWFFAPLGDAEHRKWYFSLGRVF